MHFHIVLPDEELDYVNGTEWNNLDFVVENHKRSLFCKVKNFCNLRWFDSETREPIEAEDGHIEFKVNYSNQYPIISII